jgi:hypothetical protein
MQSKKEGLEKISRRNMRTRYKIIIPAIAILTVFSFLFLRSADGALLVCEEKILNSDQCRKYLNEKYKTIPVVSHFLKISDYEGLGMEVENFKVTKVMASKIENNLVSHMEISTETSTIIYKCVALEDNENVFVELENPTIEDIDNNRCYSFDTEHLKSREELKCEQIGGNPNHPEYEGCVLPSVICGYGSSNNGDENCEQESHDMCKDLGGKIVKNLSCRESVREQYVPDPAPCDFRGPAGCEFP